MAYSSQPQRPKQPWTTQEIAKLSAYYEAARDRPLRLAALVAELGRSGSAIARKARSCGLTNQHRPKVEERQPDKRLVYGSRAAFLKVASDVAICRIAKYGHPRGALGMHHTVEARAKMSRASRASWKHQHATGTGNMSEENQQRRSDLMAEQQANDPRMRQGYSRAAGGKRADLGDRYFRSAWEANIARYLDWLKERGEIFSWEYEADTFWFDKIKRGTRSYTPDFKIVDKEGQAAYYWEVKGYDHPRGKTARERMARYYPEIRVILIDADGYKAIAKWKALIPNWETGRKQPPPQV